MRVVHGIEVNGIDVDAETRCAHWHSPLDIIAIKFKCCGRWYPCFDCHKTVADHDAMVWPTSESGEKAILCGICGHQLAIEEYFSSQNVCPQCSSPFNPACANHYNLYFATE